MKRNPTGAIPLDNDRTHFRVWSPNNDNVEVHLLRGERYIPMTRDSQGYFSCIADDCVPGDHYFYRLDGDRERPDPASRHQPEGVHGPSAVVDPSFDWDDAGFIPPTMRNSVFYELHIGTFTDAGTFDAVIPHLERLKALGITTLNIMPVAQFPGARNWGYDGVAPYAVHHDYGGVGGLKRLVNAAHQTGLAVALDVVYNHLGPEGNYIWDFGPYFTEQYHSPWGWSINLDGAGSDHVRRYFIENVLYWLDEFHIDALRLDATHALFDFSARPFLREMTAAAHDWADRHNRRVHMIAENDRSDRVLLLPREANGYGLDAQWLDDLHHTLHCALTGESDGYYADYVDFDTMLKVLREGFAYTGQFSPARQRTHGTPSADIPADRFVVCTQNHDQVGNRMLGERLSQLTDFDGLKIAAALVLCSPYVPLLFMGEEYGETAPFLYFVSHGDPDLVQAVQTGRAEEFSDFDWKGTPPDPQSEETFQRSKLDHGLREDGHHATLHTLYTELLRLRREHAAFTNPNRADTTIYGDTHILCIERHDEDETFRVVINFDLETARRLTLPNMTRWNKLMDSNDSKWGGDPSCLIIEDGEAVTLPPKSFAIYKGVS